MPLKVLFIGGTGNISEACAELAVKKGVELTFLNRGVSKRPIPKGVRSLKADIRDKVQYAKAVKGRDFDVVVNWIAFTTEHIQADLDVFEGKVGQYIFISSASAYQKPVSHYIITESTPLCNPFWEYSRNKIACEEMLNKAYRENGFPICIVRPSYTYSRTLIPAGFGAHGFTLVDRMRRGKKILVHGDGTALWTMTHSDDFAKGFTGLLGNQQALGHAFHITSDESLSWNQIYAAIGAAAGAAPRIVHVPTDLIAALEPESAPGLSGDKSWSVVFDNSKIKRFVPGFTATIPFAHGVRASVAWHDADPKRKWIDDGINRKMDRIIARYERAFK